MSQNMLLNFYFFRFRIISLENQFLANLWNKKRKKMPGKDGSFDLINRDPHNMNRYIEV